MICFYQFIYDSATINCFCGFSPFRMKYVKIKIDYISRFYMLLPKNGGFREVDLTKDREAKLGKIEK